MSDIQNVSHEANAWAVWVGTGGDNECIAVEANSQDEAEEKALAQVKYVEVFHVDGPYQGDPGVWEFEFVTEHRETVVAQGPNEDYAKETAENERSHRGDYVQTVHTTSRKVIGDGDSDE